MDDTAPRCFRPASNHATNAIDRFSEPARLVHVLVLESEHLRLKARVRRLEARVGAMLTAINWLAGLSAVAALALIARAIVPTLIAGVHP